MGATEGGLNKKPYSHVMLILFLGDSSEKKIEILFYFLKIFIFYAAFSYLLTLTFQEEWTSGNLELDPR
jgi:hypothetical protein